MTVQPTSPNSPIIVVTDAAQETPKTPTIPLNLIKFHSHENPSPEESTSTDDPPLIRTRTSHFRFRPDPLTLSQEERIRGVLQSIRPKSDRTPSPEKKDDDYLFDLEVDNKRGCSKGDK